MRLVAYANYGDGSDERNSGHPRCHVYGSGIGDGYAGGTRQQWVNIYTNHPEAEFKIITGIIWLPRSEAK